MDGIPLPVLLLHVSKQVVSPRVAGSADYALEALVGVGGDVVDAQTGLFREELVTYGARGILSSHGGVPGAPLVQVFLQVVFPGERVSAILALRHVELCVSSLLDK